MLAYISYPKEFEAAAIALDSELKRRKINTFYDKETLLPASEVWKHSIEDRIKKASIYIVLYSPEAAKPGRYFLEEIILIQRAVEANLKKIITVIFDPTKPSDLPEFFQQRQIFVSETTGILKDERDSYWIDQIVREVDRNLHLNSAKPRRQIVSLTTLTLAAVSIALLYFFQMNGAFKSPGTDSPSGNVFNDPPKDPSETNFPIDQKQENYKVVLGADANLKFPGVPGELRVWIGSPNANPNFRTGMTEAGIILPAVGETAKITPFAPTFEIEPKESACVAIHPTGSETRFQLRPTKIGIFNVGADVQLFNAPECRGAPVPKWTDTLQVTVVVNSDEAFQERSKQLGEIFWEKLKDFWGLSVALFFALLLFLIKGRLKKWFSFGNDK